MAESQFTVLVGPTDTDSYNIVHHPMYLVWCESAIYNYLTTHPDAFPAQPDTGEIPYEIEHISCKFHAPARLHDRLFATVAAPRKWRADTPVLFKVQLSNAKTGAIVMDARFSLRL